MKIKKIRQKILFVMIPIVVVSLVVVIATAYFNSKSTIEEKSGQLLKSTGEVCANNIEAWQKEVLGILDTAIKTMTEFDMDEEAILKYEELFLETYDDFPNGIYIAQSNKHLIDASGWEPEEDITTTIWYAEGMTHPDRMSFGEPYVDELTHGYIVTASTHKQLLGYDSVFAADVGLEVLSAEVAGLSVIAGGDAFILDISSGVVLASKDAGIVGKNVAEISDTYYKKVYESLKAGKNEVASYEKYITAPEAVENTDWYIVTRALEKNVYSDIRKIGMVLIGIGLFSILAVAFIIAFVVNRVTRPIDGLNTAISSVTAGDFTKDLTAKGYDEIAQMTENMQIFIQSMKKVLSEIIESATTIDMQADASNKVASELSDSAKRQAENMEVLLRNLSDMTFSITSIAENATDLAQTVMGINEAGNTVISNMESTKDEAENGKSSMTDVNKSMQLVKDGIVVLVNSISNVGSATVKIEEITDTIKNIADQTNLLALNASIEAARAGEAGRGFAVVADEIQKLAETSSDAANQISDLIKDVTELIDKTVKESHTNSERVTESAGLVDKASSQFNAIYQAIEQTNVLVHGIIADISSVSDVATNMAAITEEQSASAQEIEDNAVDIKELAESVCNNGESVNDQSEKLAGAAEVLMQNMKKFTI